MSPPTFYLKAQQELTILLSFSLTCSNCQVIFYCLLPKMTTIPSFLIEWSKESITNFADSFWNFTNFNLILIYLTKIFQ